MEKEQEKEKEQKKEKDKSKQGKEKEHGAMEQRKEGKSATVLVGKYENTGQLVGLHTNATNTNKLQPPSWYTTGTGIITTSDSLESVRVLYAGALPFLTGNSCIPFCGY